MSHTRIFLRPTFYVLRTRQHPRSTPYNLRSVEAFTLLELLVVLAVIATLASVVTVAFSRFTARQALETAASAAMIALGDARSRTLSSRAAAQYGVHFEDEAITMFRGTAYDAGDPENEVTSLDARVRITTSLAGGGSDVVFERLTGETDMHGTVSFVLEDTTLSRTITIQQTGLISYE